jgi:hypothetical protein
MHINRERTDTSADDLGDLDLVMKREYWDFPGDNVKVPSGYSHVTGRLIAALPQGTVWLGLHLRHLDWGRAPTRLHFTEGAPSLTADHVIITVSLDVAHHRQRHRRGHAPRLPCHEQAVHGGGARCGGVGEAGSQRAGAAFPVPAHGVPPGRRGVKVEDLVVDTQHRVDMPCAQGLPRSTGVVCQAGGRAPRARVRHHAPVAR